MVDTVTIGTDPAPDAIAAQKAHDEKMAAAVDAEAAAVAAPADPAASAIPERPPWMPEKFWNAETGEANMEALATSYAKLESERSRPADPAEPAPAEPAVTPDPAAAADPVQPAGEPEPSAVQKAEAEWAEKGELGDETYAALEASGLDRATVDAFIAGQSAVAQAAEAKVHAAAGGSAEAYTSLLQWAEGALSESEIAAYNTDIMDPARMETAARGLHARYVAENGSEPTGMIHGDGAPVSGSHFKSTAEMTAAMSDPKYSTDSAYRAEVSAKIKAAMDAGVRLYG